MAVSLQPQRPSNEANKEATLEIVQRIWRTKLKSITLVEKWMAKTSDLEIKAGLKRQLEDERRHLRMLGEEIKRLGGRLQGSTLDTMLERPFALFAAQTTEAYRLSAYFHGIKAFTADRCSLLAPVVDQSLGRTLEQIARDEAGHIRWAEIRLRRLADANDQRQLSTFMEKMEKSMDAAWNKSWKQITEAKHRYFPFGH